MDIYIKLKEVIEDLKKIKTQPNLQIDILNIMLKNFPYPTNLKNNNNRTKLKKMLNKITFHC